MEQIQQMNMSIVPSEFLQKMASDISELKDAIKAKTKAEINSEWMDSAEARELLGVSQKTWQTYRDERVIPFSQVGRKIYVRRSDIEAYLNKHRINQN